MNEQPKLYATVCSKCGRQVFPHVDPNLGVATYVYCSHGHGVLRGLEAVRWERVEVVPIDQAKTQVLAEVREEFEESAIWDGSPTSVAEAVYERECRRGPGPIPMQAALLAALDAAEKEH